MDSSTGKGLAGLDHLRQSVRDILSTPVGSRVMRRDYGSRLFELVDAPINKSTLVEIYASTSAALRKWEPRLKVETVRVSKAEPGKLEVSLTARYIPTNAPLAVEGIVI
jgi:phage baseplate assembly protein W